MNPPQVIIFGASGDLALRKLVPALTSLAGKDRSAKGPGGGFAVVGVARSEKSDDAFREELAAAMPEELRAAFATLAPRVFYVQGDVQQPADLARLKRRLEELPGGAESGRLYYLSLKPDLFATAAAALRDAGLLDPSGPREPFRRVIIEKPFGHDLASGRALNHDLHVAMREDQIFASIIISARRPCKTCSVFASITRSSSRSGTGTTSSTSRSRWRRSWGWRAGARGIMIAPGRCATCCRIICCRCWRWWRWSRRPRSTPSRCAARR
jgi:hypothetical protein